MSNLSQPERDALITEVRSRITDMRSVVGNDYLAGLLARLVAALEEAEKDRQEVEVAIRETCQLADSEESESPYVCLGEDGDPIIEEDTPAGAIRGMSFCWQRTQERAEKAEAALARARKDGHA